MKDLHLKGHFAMLGANIAWGLMSPISKLVMAGAIVTPLLLADMRMLGAALLFWITSMFLPKEHVPKKDLLLMAGAGMLGVLFNQGCFIFGVGFTSPGEASVITTTMPMWVMVFVWLILKEPITLKKAGGIILGATGAITLIYSSASASIVKGDNPMLGDILVLAAQFSYALYLTFYRNLIKKYSLVTMTKWMFTFASIGILLFSIPTILRTDFSAISNIEAAGCAYVVVVATFLAYILIMIGQKHLRPTIVGMYNYFQPIVAMAIGIALGLDRFTPLKALAVLLIFTGLYMVIISKAKSPSPSPTE